jgi:hypothetical protein
LTLGRPIFTTFFLEEKKIILLFFSAAKIFAKKVYFLLSAESPKKCICSHFFSAESLALSNKIYVLYEKPSRSCQLLLQLMGAGGLTNVDFIGMDESKNIRLELEGETGRQTRVF